MVGTSSGWLTGSVASPYRVAVSRTALSASPARSWSTGGVGAGGQHRQDRPVGLPGAQLALRLLGTGDVPHRDDPLPRRRHVGRRYAVTRQPDAAGPLGHLSGHAGGQLLLDGRALDQPADRPALGLPVQHPQGSTHAPRPAPGR